jgi:hypothetical protein
MAVNAVPVTMVRGRVYDVVQVNPGAGRRMGRKVATRTESPGFSRPLPPSIDLSPDGSDQQMAEERILDTYHSVWDDFYTWETVYASEVIVSLATDIPTRASPVAEDSYFTQDIDILTFSHLKRSISGVPRSPSRALPTVQPHPRYQACTPSNQNVMAKRPRCNPFVTPLFIPFADEPRFQSKYFIEEFLQDGEDTDPKLYWQFLSDPDCEQPHLNTLHNSALNVQSGDHATSGIPEASQTWVHQVSD